MKKQKEIQTVIANYENDIATLKRQRDAKGINGIGIEMLNLQIKNCEIVIDWLKWVLK